MNKPKTFSAKASDDAWLELALLFAIIAGCTIYLMQVHWAVAIVLTPFVMVVVLATIVAVVHALWLFVVGLERLGQLCGLRKTPLS